MITCEFCGTQQEQHDHWRHLIMSRVAALEEFVTREPAEPSGTGQLTSAPAGFRVVGQSGPGVVQSKGLWIRRARDYRDGSPANGEPRQITMPGSLGGVWDAGEYDILEPIAEPPALAVGTLSERMRNDIRTAAGAIGAGGSLPALERDCDEVAALEARLAQAERERDELGRQVEQMAAHVSKMRMELDEASRVREDKALRERDEMATSREWWMERYNEAAKERDEATATIERVAYNTPEAVARSESDVTVLIELRRAQKERDEATARERERCLAWFTQWETTGMTKDYRDAGIRSGKPAPGTDAPAPKCDPDPPREVAPDRAQAGSGGQSDDDADEAMIHDAARLRV